MFDRERPTIPSPFLNRIHRAAKPLESTLCPIHFRATPKRMATNVWFRRVSPNPAFIIDVRRQSFTHTKESLAEYALLLPLSPTWPRRHVTVKERFRYEPLKCHARETVRLANSLNHAHCVH